MKWKIFIVALKNIGFPCCKAPLTVRMPNSWLLWKFSEFNCMYVYIGIDGQIHHSRMIGDRGEIFYLQYIEQHYNVYQPDSGQRQPSKDPQSSSAVKKRMEQAKNAPKKGPRPGLLAEFGKGTAVQVHSKTRGQI